MSDAEDPRGDEPDGPQADEDWKAQVEAEKATADEETPGETEAAPDPLTETVAEDEKGASEPPPEADPPQLPPATFDILIVTLATQAMALLGQGGNPQTDQAMARHHIDLLAMLEEKTEGNRTKEETTLLANLLHELRMQCLRVESSGGADPSTADQEDADPSTADQEDADPSTADQEDADPSTADQEDAEASTGEPEAD